VEEACPGAETPAGSGMPPSSRITRTREIRVLFRRGRRKKTSHLDVFFLSSLTSQPRVGLVVPKYRRNAVARNRIKRRLREVSRREILPRLRASSMSLDLLIRARSEAYDTSYRQLRLELLKVTEELCSGQSSWG
jgi:ribonuclease P protein component